MNLEELEKQNPQLASVMKSLAVYTAQDVEKSFITFNTSESRGADKVKVAKEMLVGCLTAFYESQDRINNYPDLTDAIFKTVIIPLIPETIEWAVKLMNELGIFKHGSQLEAKGSAI